MTLRKLFFLTLLLISSAASAQVGMITQIGGDVSIATAGSGTKAVAALQKVNPGDKLTLGGSGRIQMVYFGNGRQELWKGAGQIEIGGLQSMSNSIKPELSVLPQLVVNQLAKTPASGQQGKTGMIRMRSMDNPDAAARLDRQYQELRGKSAADDATPEIFLLSGLVEHRQFDRAKTLLADLESKPEFKAVVDYFKPLVDNAGK